MMGLFRRRKRAAPGAETAPAPAHPQPPAPVLPAYQPQPLAGADRAERAGDLPGAAVFLRAHLAREPADRRSRLRLGRLLLATGERRAARQALVGLDEDDDLALEANALLADIEEGDGALGAAVERWERVLADRVDHPQARARLAALRSGRAPASADRGIETAAATFVSPEGVRAMRWRLLRELGRGASAAVYLARDESLGIEVALKVLHPHLGHSARSESCRRFFAEARTAAALRHPGVVAIYDLDEATRSLAMEYLAGGTLKQRLAAGAPGPDEAIATARSLLGALAFVHGSGVTHGDLKPSNLLLRRPGSVVLADFGIARLGPAASPEPGRPAEIPAGTPLYLAPEQFRGAPASPFTDLYAAGAILWETLAGRALRTHADLIAQRIEAPPLPPLPPEVEGLAELAARLLTPDPAARLPSAALALKFVR